MRKGSGSVTEFKTGPRANDEIAGHQELRRSIPLSDGQPGIGAKEAEELVHKRERLLETMHRVDGVVRTVSGKGSVEVRHLDSRISCEGKAGHRDAIVETGDGGLMLERLHPDGSDQDAIQMDTSDSQTGEGDVSAVGRVEAAAEERDSHFVDAK